MASATDTPPGAPTRAMVEAAARWHACLQDGAGDVQRDEWQAWRAADPRHELAWQRMEALWSRFDGAPGRPARTALDAAAHASAQARPRRRGAARLAGMAALALAALVGWQALPGTHLLADHRSGVGQTRTVRLPDGSRLTLGSGSAVDLRFGEHERRVLLRDGELLADVAPDPSRPFVVETPQGSARALGTRFLVRRAPEGDAGATAVTVIESRVRACAADAAAPCAELGPGEQARIDATGVHAPRRVDAQAEAAWTRGQLVADDRPVAEVLAALARRRHGHVQFDPVALRGVRVSGVLPLDDTDRALAVLAATLPLRVRRFTDWWVVVEPRPDAP